MSLPVEFRSVLDFGLDPAAALATQGFADYVIPIPWSAAGVLTMVRQDSVDLGASRVVVADGREVGVAFVARRGWTSRLAAMAVVPDARGRGVGDACVRHLLAEARARGERSMTLEVIEQNEPAVRLYKRCGFRTDRRLVGFEGEPADGGSAGHAEATDLREIARALIAHGPADLPWQLSGETLAQLGPPAVGYRGEDAWVALSDPTAPAVAIRALITDPRSRRRGSATALLRAMVARHRGRKWRVPAIWPEESSGPFERIGLRRTSLSQLQMTIELGEDPAPGR